MTPSLASTILACDPQPSSTIGPTTKPPSRRREHLRDLVEHLRRLGDRVVGEEHPVDEVGLHALDQLGGVDRRLIASSPPTPLNVKPKLSSIAVGKRTPMTSTSENGSGLRIPMA